MGMANKKTRGAADVCSRPLARVAARATRERMFCSDDIQPTALRSGVERTNSRLTEGAR